MSNHPVSKNSANDAPRDVSLEDLASLDANVQIPTDLLFGEDTEQIGARTRKKQLAHGKLLTTVELAKTETFEDGAFFLGRSVEGDLVTMGEGEDQEFQSALLGSKGSGHVTLIAPTQVGKSQRFLIPTLVTWTGSAIVIDPKGALASVTAERRGEGNKRYDMKGMGQKVFVLDPRRVSKVPDTYFKRFNPLTWLSEDDPSCFSKSRSLADALIPDTDTGGDTYWKDEGRDLLAIVMVYVATDPDFEMPRTLNTVLELLLIGDELNFNAIKEDNPDFDGTPMKAFLSAMAGSPSLEGIVARAGKSLSNLCNNALKQWEGILSQAKQSLSWVSEKAMRDCLSATDFSFDQLRTDPQGVTVYVTVEKMSRDWRWLRMISEIFLADSMASTLPVKGQTLFVLDEFPQMKRMKTMLDAIAITAEYGVRMCVVIQSLAQLQAKDAYPDEWEVIVSNCRARIVFGAECLKTSKYASDLLGEKQIVLKNRSMQVSANFNEGQSQAEGKTTGESNTLSQSASTSKGGSKTQGGSTSSSESQTRGQSANNSRNKTAPMKNPQRRYLVREKCPC